MLSSWYKEQLIVSFDIPGRPLPKERPRVVPRKGKMVAYTPKKTRAYEQSVAQVASIAMRGNEPYTGLVVVRCDFYRARRNADPDNLFKAVADAMQGIVYKNDNQVVEMHAVWHRDKDEHAHVDVWATSE